MTIGERIKNRRIELGLTQEEVAKKCGYKSRSSVNKIELSRDLPLKKIEIMANALETTPSYLMGWNNNVEAKLQLSPTEEAIIETSGNHKTDKELYNHIMEVYSDKTSLIPEIKIAKAVELYDKIEKAEPNIKEAILSLLKGVQ